MCIDPFCPFFSLLAFFAWCQFGLFLFTGFFQTFVPLRAFSPLDWQSCIISDDVLLGFCLFELQTFTPLLAVLFCILENAL